MLLPWQHTIFQQLQQCRRENRLPHAILLSGPAGIGKQALAEAFALSLLCESPHTDGTACGACHACAMLRAGSHPDLHRIGPEDISKNIRIDQIRALIETLSLRSHYGRHKVVILNPADAMNTAAANSLLKTLEEPPSDTILLLLSARPSRLPATIRSRCQTLHMATPHPEEAASWLKSQLEAGQETETLLALAGGAPLTALQLAEDERLASRKQMLSDWLQLANGEGDPVRLASNWVKPDAALPITWIYGWLTDMIRLRASQTTRLNNPDAKATLQKLAEELDLQRIYGMLDRVQDAMRLLDSQVNPQMILEGILLYWRNLPRTAKNN